MSNTVGFKPSGGLVMGTRTGDLGPGVLAHLLRTEGLSADGLDDLVNRSSGSLGVSGVSSDMGPPCPAGNRRPGGRRGRVVLLSGSQVGWGACRGPPRARHP